MNKDRPTLTDRALRSGDRLRKRAQSNVERLSDLLENDELTDTLVNPVDKTFDARKFKIIAVTGAAAGIMGVAGFFHKDTPKKHSSPPQDNQPAVEMISEETPTVGVEMEEVSEISLAAEPESVPQISEEGKRPPSDDSLWWHDVPVQTQQGLTYRGERSNYGCVPAAVNMITEYWHRQNSEYETISAQELLDLNMEQGAFGAKGMSITRAHDELKDLGYQMVKDYAEADLNTLKREVDKGPVIAIVKLHMTTGGVPHSVVVTGISDDNQVRVNDPWTGEAHLYTWEEFARSWGSEFAGASTRNHFTVIRPA
jgi:predicted double-glycine peptidase